jgi:hypothetical protein
MLTLIECISLAGDRAKQNDDACGARGTYAWVIDGATDLHDAPRTSAASDAAWLARFANASLNSAEIAADEASQRAALRAASTAASHEFSASFGPLPTERWKHPVASLMLASESQNGLTGLDLGDCRCFARGGDGASHALGGPPQAADREAELAAQAAQKTGAQPLLRDADTLALLRTGRARHNTPGGHWVFGLQPECAEHARVWSLHLTRPAYILLCTDGFSALTDRYAAYDAPALVQAACDKGLQELGRELRAIEAADGANARFPRWKASDDATALLLRLN